MFVAAGYGFDVTDEGSWLQWVASPGSYLGGFTRFGFAYHWLYVLLEGDVVSLRRANLGVTGAAAVVCGWVVLRSMLPAVGVGRVAVAALAACLAPAALLVNQNIGPTPSYNSLALQALLVAVLGAFAAGPDATRRSALGWLALGAGGWLLFLARPTAAALFLVVVVLFLRASGRWRFAPAAGAAAVAAGGVLLTGIVVDGGPAAMVENMLGGAMRYGSTVPGYTFLHMLSRFVRPDPWQIGAGASTVGIAIVAAVLAQRMRPGLPAALVLLVLPVTAIVFGYRAIAGAYGNLFGMLVAVPALATAVAVWHARRAAAVDSHRTRALAETAFLLFLPMVWGFGSNVTYYRGNAGFFYVLGGASLLRMLPATFGGAALTAQLGAYTLAVQVCVSITQIGFLNAPYRHPGPLFAADAPLRLGRSTAPVHVNAGVAASFDAAAAAARRAGLARGTWMVDLSGVSPGLLHHLGALGAGSPWLIGHYPTRDLQARVMLAHDVCESLAGAWVLDEPGSRWRIDPAVMNSFGADIVRDYERAADWPSVDGSYASDASRRQVLYRPRRTFADAVAACRAARR